MTMNPKASRFEPSEEDLEFLGQLMKAVPERYRNFKLHNMQPSALVKLPPQRQQQVLDFLRTSIAAKPEVSVRLYGPAGTGKTAIMAALYHLAACRQLARRIGYRDVISQSLFWADMGAWAEEMVAFNFGNGVAPKGSVWGELTPERIAYRMFGSTPVLCLDEFDKVRTRPNSDGAEPPTLVVTNALVRAAYDKNARFIMTTNLTPDEFTERFSKHIDRRLGDDGNVININLFK
jgi:predicted ATPase